MKAITIVWPPDIEDCTDTYYHEEAEIDRILAIGQRPGLGTLYARSILCKGERIVILRGTWHVAPKSFYDNNQRDIDLATSLAFTIFREGYDVRNVNIYSLGFRQLLIYYYLRRVLPLYYKMRATLNEEYEEHDILDFPSANTVWVDMDKEIIDHLKNVGFAFYWPLFVILRLAILINLTISKKVFGRFLFDFIIERGLKVFLDLRDELVVNKIEKSQKERIYVHYGDGHVKTMRGRLVQNGWKPFTESSFMSDPKTISIKERLIEFWRSIIYRTKYTPT